MNQNFLLIPSLVLSVSIFLFCLYKMRYQKGRKFTPRMMLFLMAHFIVYFIFISSGMYEDLPAELHTFIASGGWGNVIRLQTLITIISIEIYGYLRNRMVYHAA